jgi:hypothetical protein
MTDVSETANGVILKIMVKGGVEVEVDSSKITDMDVYQAIFVEGLKAILSKGAVAKLSTGITKKSEKEQGELKKAIHEEALKMVHGLYEGQLKTRGATKRSGAVQTEAMRLAKALVKDTLRSNGYKISAFDAKTLTAYAKDVLAANSELYKKAEENLAQRAAMPVKGLDVKAMLGEKAGDETFKAKPKVPPTPRKKGEGKPISAAEAAKVAPRAKPQHTTAH